MATVVQKEVVQVDYVEENDYHYAKERLYYIGWIKRLGIVAVLVAIASIVLASIQLTTYVSFLTVSLVVAASVFFLGAILSIVWANKASKTYRADAELFQPRINDRLTKAIFVGGLILAGAAAIVLVNLYVQQEYPSDYFVAQDTNASTWNDKYEGRTEQGLINYSKTHFIVQGVFAGFFFFFFLLASRAAFRCLKWSNQAMSYLVFLGNVLLLAFGLGIVFYASYIFGYGDYPQIRAHFPVWNIRGIYIIGIAVAALSLVGFLVDHKSWRVGFFVLAFLLLVLLVLLVNFTGYAYRHTRQTYEYYKGVNNTDICLDRMRLVHLQDLEDYGCPAKYTPLDQCNSSQTAQKWEYTNDDSTGVVKPAPRQPAASQRRAVSTVHNPDGTVVTTHPDGHSVTVNPDGTTVTQTADGTTTSVAPSGTTTVEQKDGTATTHQPDGSTTTTQTDGSSVTVNKDGSTTTTEKDGTTTTKNTDGSSLTTKPDGTQVYTAQDGTVTTKTPDGFTQIKFTDGTSVVKQPDGTTTTRSPDGTTSTSYPDNSAITTDPDGTTTTQERDGTKTTRKPDGTVYTKSPDGTFTTSKPDGTVVAEYTNGTTVTRQPDDTTTRVDKDGTTTTTSANGKTVTTTYPNGTTHTSTVTSTLLFADDSRALFSFGAKKDATLTTKLPGGVTVTTKKDGTVVSTSGDGRTVTTRSTSGYTATRISSSTHSNSGYTTIENDGTITTRLSDGRTISTKRDGTVVHTSADGKVTTTTSPDGTTATSASASVSSFFYDDVSSSQDFYNDLLNLDSDNAEYCLNTRCCGLLGELYTEPLLSLANFGLAATLAGCLVSIGCYYFWYVTWVDSARNKKKDFIWLGAMAVIVIVFFGLFFGLDPAYVHEKLGANGQHL